MRKKYFKDNSGSTAVFDPIGTDNGKCEFYIIWHGGCFLHKLTMHFRAERTWDDHTGNTDCGYYVNCPMPWGGIKRIYVY